MSLKTVLRILAVMLVAGLAWLLRARAVALLPVDYDEDDYLRAAQEYAQGFGEGDLRVLQTRNYRPEHPPLAKILYGLSITSLPEGDLVPDLPTSAAPNEQLPVRQLQAARTLSAIFGTVEALLLAILSPLAGFMLAIHTFTIKYTSQVMLEGFPALSSAVSVIAFERWCEVDEKGKGRFAIGWLLLSGITLGLTAASKYIYAVVGIVIIIYWIWRSFPRIGVLSARKIIKMLQPILVWGVLSLLVFFLANPYLWPAPLDRLSDSILYHGRYATGAEEVQRANYVFWQPLNTLFMSVPWHPGVFVFMLDTLIAMLALLGFRQAWRKRSIYALWLLVGIIFLLLWPTKWPQYTLLVTFPLALIASDGLIQQILRPLRDRLLEVRARGFGWGVRRASPGERRQRRRSIPWLLPGAIVLIAITFFPLIYQGAIALTDFNATSIRDGLNGGVWREVLAGLSGQVQPIEVDLFSFDRSTSREVHYTGFRPLLQIFGPGMSLLLFEILWTGAVVGLQVVLGVAAALLLHKRGVRMKGLWQTILILPWAIPEFVGALVWMQIFDPRFGWFFLGSKSFGETPGFVYAQQLATWQDNPNTAMGVLLIAGLWLGFPLIMLAASAGLKLIPEEVYEAAALDGASGFNLFKNITWPLLLPLLAPALIIRAIYAFNQFYLFFVLNPPFPLVTFANISYYFFYFGGQYAASAIINILAVVILIFFLFGFNRISRAGEGVTYA